MRQKSGTLEQPLIVNDWQYWAVIGTLLSVQIGVWHQSFDKPDLLEVDFLPLDLSQQ